jgi:hypothetical protein
LLRYRLTLFQVLLIFFLRNKVGLAADCRVKNTPTPQLASKLPFIEIMMFRKRIVQLSTIILLAVILALVLSFILRGNDTPDRPDHAPKSFTFFGVGADTLFSKVLRKELGDKLGSEAIEYRSIIDLETNFKGFLERFFPDLNTLNQRLNYPAGERVDHNTVKLMYRYAQKKDVPFHYIELLFSNYTRKPLLIKIESEKDVSEIINSIKKKYGQPVAIDWQKDNGRSMLWENKRDILLTSVATDRRGDPVYHITIYYYDNLKELVNTEKKERRLREEKKKQAGKKAF